MSIKEANRLSVMRQVDKKILSLQKASEELGVSLRQVKRIRKRYLSDETLRQRMIETGCGRLSQREREGSVKDEFVEVGLKNYCRETGLDMHGLRTAEKSVQ